MTHFKVRTSQLSLPTRAKTILLDRVSPLMYPPSAIYLILYCPFADVDLVTQALQSENKGARLKDIHTKARSRLYGHLFLQVCVLHSAFSVRMYARL
jgi:hypothetical protein